MGKRKKICVAFLGNALYDSRVLNFYTSLKAEEYSVKVVAFDWEGHKKEEREDIKIIPIRRRPALRFYFSFYFHLIKEFLFEKCDYFFAEDVFTLPFAALLKKLKGFSLIYDSRELYPFLAGLREKSFNQKLVAFAEKIFIGFADKVLVTGELDKEFLQEYYKLSNVVVQRNLPRKREIFPQNLREKFKIPKDYFLLVYQGVLLEGRGIALIIKALRGIDNIKFLIFGSGDFKENFHALAKEEEVEEKVIFAGRVPQEELLNYTASADLGVAVIENLSKSYYYALPNKLFEYIAAGVPVLVSDLPQMKKVVEEYKVGEVVKELTVEGVREKLLAILEGRDKLQEYRGNCKVASEELNWEREFERNKRAILE